MHEAGQRERERWTIRDVLGWTSKRFAELRFSTPLLDAQLLLCGVLKIDKVQLYMQMDRPLTTEERGVYRSLVQRRLALEPVAYILGKKYWHDLELVVDHRVLIPRPETESLLDFVLAVWRQAKRTPLRVLDLCTGSGCLAIALARKFPDAKVVGVDISAGALEVARANAASYGLENLEFVEADVRDPTIYSKLARDFGCFDVVVANPPYLSEHEWLETDGGVRNFEPKEALVADESGLAIAKTIIGNLQARGLLSSESVFCMETGCGHGTLMHPFSDTLSSGRIFRIFAFHAPIWELPRVEFFGLRDLETKDRFVCRISGLFSDLEESSSTAEKAVGDVDSGFDEA